MTRRHPFARSVQPRRAAGRRTPAPEVVRACDSTARRAGPALLAACLAVGAVWLWSGPTGTASANGAQSTSPPPRATPAPRAAAVVLPPEAAPADYQLGGSYPPAPGVRVVSRDRTSGPARGIYSICYVNGFQTQADEDAWWTGRHEGLLLHDAAGHRVEDPDWPGEYLLDTRTAAARAAIAAIVGDWVRGCAARGFQAVEADNLDSWTRSHGLLSEQGNAALAGSLADRAHRAGLAFGQKNTPELAPQARRLGFDFAVAEECHAYHECNAYTSAYGRRVIDIEYVDNGGRAGFEAACRRDHGRMSMVLRDRDLSTPSAKRYVYRSC